MVVSFITEDGEILRKTMECFPPMGSKVKVGSTFGEVTEVILYPHDCGLYTDMGDIFKGVDAVLCVSKG